MKPLWDTLYKAGADVVINGHDHDYERFAPQEPDGKLTKIAAFGSLLLAVAEGLAPGVWSYQA